LSFYYRNNFKGNICMKIIKLQIGECINHIKYTRNIHICIVYNAILIRNIYLILQVGAYTLYRFNIRV